jgi:hypothetical protein
LFGFASLLEAVSRAGGDMRVRAPLFSPALLLSRPPAASPRGTARSPEPPDSPEPAAVRGRACPSLFALDDDRAANSARCSGADCRTPRSPKLMFGDVADTPDGELKDAPPAELVLPPPPPLAVATLPPPPALPLLPAPPPPPRSPPPPVGDPPSLGLWASAGAAATANAASITARL